MESKVRCAWKKTRFIFYNPVCIIDKVCQGLLSSYTTIPPSPTLLLLEKISNQVKDIRESMCNQLASSSIPSKCCMTWLKSAKTAFVADWKVELYEKKLNEVNTAEKT